MAHFNGTALVRSPKSYLSLEEFGRVRLSKHFEMRNFLYSEIGNFYAKPNLPLDPDLAIAAGRCLAETILEPISEKLSNDVKKSCNEDAQKWIDDNLGLD